MGRIGRIGSGLRRVSKGAKKAKSASRRAATTTKSASKVVNKQNAKRAAEIIIDSHLQYFGATKYETPQRSQAAEARANRSSGRNNSAGSNYGPPGAH
ncbi:MAG: hypothetical protein ACI9YB_002646 [Halioglobus sp.]|jgi:hypothetical protein